MEKLRPVEDVVDEIYQSSKLPNKVLQADRRAHEEIIGRNVDRALRAAGCPERFLQTACVATVVMPPPESERVRLGRVIWEDHRAYMLTRPGMTADWNRASWSEVELWRKEECMRQGQVVAAELAKIREE